MLQQSYGDPSDGFSQDTVPLPSSKVKRALRNLEYKRRRKKKGKQYLAASTHHSLSEHHTVGDRWYLAASRNASLPHADEDFRADMQNTHTRHYRVIELEDVPLWGSPLIARQTSSTYRESGQGSHLPGADNTAGVTASTGNTVSDADMVIEGLSIAGQ